MKKSVILIVLAFFSIYVIWGSTYLLNKIAVGKSLLCFWQPSALLLREY